MAGGPRRYLVAAITASRQRHSVLRAGEAAVIASDAIDHRDFVADLHDLTRADFELIGSSDVDNPLVPSRINIGLGEWDARNGHGDTVHAFDHAWALADSFDEQSLQVDYLPVVAPEYRLVPAEKILDVYVSGLTPAKAAGLAHTYCDPAIHESFDRQLPQLIDDDLNAAMGRRLVVTRDDGQVILQRTRTSARDFEMRPGTPGRVP